MKFNIPITTHKLGARNSTSKITKVIIHTKALRIHKQKDEIIDYLSERIYPPYLKAPQSLAMASLSPLTCNL